MIFVLLGFFFSISALSSEVCFEPTPFGVAEQKLLEATRQIWQGCSNEEKRFSALAKARYEKAFPPSAPKQMGAVAGLRLSGSATELEAIREMLGKRPPSGWQQKVKGCTTVLCATTKLFGSEESAHLALAIFRQTGYLVKLDQHYSPQGVEQLWSVTELRAIDRVLRLLPSEFYHLPTLEGFYRMADNYRVEGHSKQIAAFADSNKRSIVCYESIHLHDGGAAAIVLHEILHHHDFSNHQAGELFSSHSRFSELSGWDRGSSVRNPETGVVEQKYTARAGARFVRDYASGSPLEDFAESSTYYVMNPMVLKQLDPEKYEFIREKVFKGKEFSAGVDGLRDFLENGKWVKDTLNSCEAKLKQFSRSPDGKLIELYYPAPSADRRIQNYLVYPSVESFLKKCAEDSVGTLASAFPESTQFCVNEAHTFAGNWVVSQVATFEKILDTKAAGKMR